VARQFLRRNRRDDSGAEHHQDELAAQRGIYGGQRGKQDDIAEHLQRTQAERQSGLDLAATDASMPARTISVA
jgi:hypothetical protein